VKNVIENDTAVNERYYAVTLKGSKSGISKVETKICSYAKALEEYLRQIGISGSDPNLMFLANLQNFIGKSDPAIFLQWDNAEYLQKKQQALTLCKSNPKLEKAFSEYKDNNLHFVEGFTDHVLDGGTALRKKYRKGVVKKSRQALWWLLPALAVYSELLYNKREWAVLCSLLDSNGIFNLAGPNTPDHEDLETWWDNNIRKATKSKYEKLGLGLKIRLQESIFLYKQYLEGKPYYIRQPNQFAGQEYNSKPSIKKPASQEKQRILKKYQEVVSKNFKGLFLV